MLITTHTVCCLASLLLLVGAVRGADAPRFKAGFAERDITPKLGMEQPGGYGKVFHRTKHDSCKVRASVFDDGQSRVAVVGIDALLIRGTTVAAARKAIHTKCGIAPEAILIAASHSHSAGPTGMILPGEFDHASDLVKKLAYEKSSMADAAYLAQVEQSLIDAVVEADAKRVPARAAVGLGSEERVAFNRRFRMTGGTTMTHPGQGNPDIIEPAGPIDPQVGVIGAWDQEGKFLGCVVNFSCHATTGPGGISADYVHYIEKTIRGLMGEDSVVVFTPGMAGDVTQVDNRSPYQIKQFGEVSARFVGGRVGAEALKVLLAVEQTAGALTPVAFKIETLKIPRRAPRPERLARSLVLVQADSKGVDATEWTFAKEIVLLDARLTKEPIANVEVQAIQIGPVVLLSSPAEYFCQYGLDIKSGSKFPFTFPVSLANDCVGYVPTEEALSPRGGGYETRLTSYSNLEPTAGRKIANAAIGLAGRFTPGAIPTPAALPPFQGKPWAYGSLPPELD
jgi:neutral ceramidase